MNPALRACRVTRRPGPPALVPAIVAVAIGVSGLAGLAGCESPIATSDPDLVAADARAKGLNVPGRRTRPGGVVPGLEQGLRSRQWRVVEADIDTEIGAVIAAFGVEPPVDSGLTDDMLVRLAGNGLRIVAVPVERLPELRVALGRAAMDAETWHGEAPDWRDLAVAEIGGRGTAVAMQGRVRRWDRGSFRLRVRAWTMRMEDGPHLQMDLAVGHIRTSRSRGLLAGRPSTRSRIVDGLRFEIATPRDIAWVIASAPVAEEWPALGTPLELEDPAASESGDGGAEAEAAAVIVPRDPDSLPGPLVVFGDEPDPDEGASRGPSAGPITTVGRVLLERSLAPGTRDIVILEPQIPDGAFAEGMLPSSDAAGDAAGGVAAGVPASPVR